MSSVGCPVRVSTQKVLIASVDSFLVSGHTCVPTNHMTCQDLSATVTDLFPTAGPSEDRPIQESFIFQRTAKVNCGLTGQSSVAAFLIIAFFFVHLDGTRHQILPLSLS